MIQLFQVSKIYDGTVVALDQVTLQIPKGALLFLTGSSGAGKTTLLRTIFAAERPDSGQVVIAGRNIARLRSSSIPFLRRNIGVVFQDFRLVRGCSALRNVALPLEIRGISAPVVRERSLEALAAVGLDKVAQTPVGTLSGGEQQRVAIARALVARPAVILADEPTGNLDPEWTEEILALLHEHVRAGATIVVATHDPQLVQPAHCTHVARLEAGRLVELSPGCLLEPASEAGRRCPEWIDAPRPAPPHQALLPYPEGEQPA